MDKILSYIQSKAEEAEPLSSTLKFNFGEQQLYIDGTGDVNQVSTENKEAACQVDVDWADFLALSKGELDPMSAVMNGKIVIKGDMGVAMRLQSLFGG
ncbi:MAG: SCP2 sterol-binding domain-containing protein [Bacteroidetes bacterium]|nr:SCP2 sterol-binding domain-containing protein [Bacteroidota bacterium]